MTQPVTCPPDLTLAPLSVAQYHAMRDAGILGESDDVELLDGMLVLKTTKLPPHSVACTLVKDALDAIVPAGFHLRVQDPITTADSEPEPDVVVARGRARDYTGKHPGPADVVLVVEIADDSLARDRGTKRRRRQRHCRGRAAPLTDTRRHLALTDKSWLAIVPAPARRGSSGG